MVSSKLVQDIYVSINLAAKGAPRDTFGRLRLFNVEVVYLMLPL